MSSTFVGPSSFNPTSPTGPFGSPVHCVVSPPHISEDLPRPSTAPMRTSSKDVSGAPLIVCFSSYFRLLFHYANCITFLLSFIMISLD